MKQQRHITIREILEGSPVASQDDLRRRLAKRGFHVTQATLSRDTDDNTPGIRDVLRSFGLEARQALNLLVVITTTGGAQPVAAGIDYEDWPEVVGTIAGDDTVLIICPDDKQAKHLRGRMEALIG